MNLLEAMRLAVEEAKRGAGFVSPNPLVGCVILDRDGKLLASGYHTQYGKPHAEVEALSKIGDAALLKDATLVVTLEPCAHEGKTPSCAKALAKQPLARVVYGLVDPFELVSGKGAEIVRAAGIRCEEWRDVQDIPGTDREAVLGELEDVAEIFLHNVRSKEPFVAVKVASSLDGMMAFDTGESKWITGESSREFVQELRQRYDAVMVGRNTIEHDNPRLNVRTRAFKGHENKVVVLDPGGKTLAELPGSDLLKVRAPEKLFVVVRDGIEYSNPAGVKVLRVATDVSGMFQVQPLMQALWDNGIYSVLVEGGSQTFSVFFKAGKVRRVHLFIAPHLMGGEHGLSWSRYFGVGAMKDRLNLQRVRTMNFPPDVYVTGRL